MSKLRILGLDESTTPRELKRLFEEFGDVAEVSIHFGKGLFSAYALVEMPYEAANVAQCRLDRQRWHGQFIYVRWATRSRGGWLSPDWTPPKPQERIEHDPERG
jgi:RNA recognition motif-containing protein